MPDDPWEPKREPVFARALCAYNTSPDDLDKFSFAKNERFRVQNTTGDCWHVSKLELGHESGVVPSNFFVLISGNHREWVTDMIASLTRSDLYSRPWDEQKIQQLRFRVAFIKVVATGAVTALARGFKYETPRAQLLTIKVCALTMQEADWPSTLPSMKLWACLLKYPSKNLVRRMSSRGFLDAIENVLDPTRKSTNPVVRETMLKVVASVAHDIDGYGAWNNKLVIRSQPQLNTLSDRQQLHIVPAFMEKIQTT
ncbi:hypothetical protein PM082_009124 [Marasmius tenuissimus]|nr:hypothetical protein PM082_009124 [Marasmius tenuissimus]